jgi:molecular chaperone DnaK
MTRTTVDFGIDLGTTNSAISVLKGMDVEVIKNNEGWEYTPSAVFIDRNNATIVGRSAKERSEGDDQNVACEFKLQMGTNAVKEFTRSGRRMRPEELSAEVLKSLKGDVKQHTGEDIQAAVITVPAAFELPQCKATDKSAKLAGINFSPLLQEPVAAALAYGFQSESDKVFWLVYDLGGGTFDAAVVQVRDGVIQVVNHGGDNHLGGKLIDWAIVEQLLIPAVVRENKLADFHRGNPKWMSAIAKLKLHAEKAKIRVSRDASAEILIDFLCQDDDGEPVRFEYDLRRSEVEQMAEPFIIRSLNITKQILSEEKLAPGDIEKVLLVGGPTLAPYLRARLSDPKEGLGISLEFSVDPLTVVSRGAAIFAGTQRNPATMGAGVATLVAGQYALDLDYKPVGADPEPLVGGRVVSNNGQDFSGFSIEFVNEEARPAWRSGKVPLAAAGAFMVSLWAEKGKQNVFKIELTDPQGTMLKTMPDNLIYKVGMVMDTPPLIHSVGVGLASNEVKWYFEKGTPLPARKRNVHKLAVQMRKDHPSDSLRIPVYEGDKKKADRNSLIGMLEVKSTEIKRDLRAGDEVEVTIEIDTSRLIKTKAYIAVLDEEFEKVIELEQKIPELNVLEKEIEYEKKRLEVVRDKVNATGDSKATPILERLDDEQMLTEVEASFGAARTDADAAGKCQNRLRALKAAVDELEDALEAPSLLEEARQAIEWCGNVVEEYGGETDKQRYNMLKRELTTLMEARVLNPTALRMKIGQMDSLRVKVLTAQNGWWVNFLAQLEEHRAEMTNQSLSDQLFTQAMRAINNNDAEGLKSACRQLLQLLPPEQGRAMGIGSLT